MLSRFLTCRLIALALVVGIPAAAPALGLEYLGNARVESQGGWSTAFVDAVNNPRRVYGYEVNGNPTFFFHGNADDLNQAIVQFAAIPAEKREIILLPGPGEVSTFDRKTKIAYGWSIHVPMGFHFKADEETGDTRTTMIIRIPAVRVAPLKVPAGFEGLLADLDSKEFRVRDRASKGLRDLGPGAAPLLRKASAATASAEVRARLEVLLAPHGGVQLDLLAIPADIPVVGVDELLERYRKGLGHKSAAVRNYAINALVQPGVTPADMVLALDKLVRSETDESVLRTAAASLASLGAGAKPAVAALRAKVKDMPPRQVQSLILAKDGEPQPLPLRQTLKEAADAIEKAEALPANELDKSQATIRSEIGAFVKARDARQK